MRDKDDQILSEEEYDDLPRERNDTCNIVHDLYIETNET